MKFLSRGGGYSLFLTATEAVMELKKTRSNKKPQNAQITRIKESEPERKESGSEQSVKSVDDAVLRMKLVGANASARIEGADELPGKSNYFIGNDPAKWHTNVPTYAKVKYAGVYPGIDLVYYGNQRQLEYDFVAAPGADPRVIRLAIGGEEKLRIDGQGASVSAARQVGDVKQTRQVIRNDRGGISPAFKPPGQATRATMSVREDYIRV